MIAERGLPGFTLTKLGGNLGLSRGLASYHFEGGRAQVIETALTEVFDGEKQPEGLGLSALFSWIGELSQRAATREPKLLALLQLAIGPDPDGEVSALRATYWTRQGDLIRRHLDTAKASGEIRDDLESGRLAGVLLGQVHGELLRLVATGEAPDAEFPAFIERALAPERPTPKASPKGRAKPPPQTLAGAGAEPAAQDKGGPQPDLFGGTSDRR